jgi:hypothetical protein
MTEHRIRLRGGWEVRALDERPGEVKRLTLPIRWDFERPRRLRLTRRFQRPPLQALSPLGSRPAGHPELVLVLEDVPGIVSLELNGESTVYVSPEQTCYQVPLGRLPQRNQLELEIETPCANDRTGGDVREWGSIALVVRAAGTGDVVNGPEALGALPPTCE